MWNYFALRRVGFALLETLVLACCGLAGYFFYFAAFPSSGAEALYVLFKGLIVALVFQFFLHLSDLYQFHGLRFSYRFFELLLGAIVLAVLVTCIIFFVFSGRTTGHGVLTWNLILAALFVFLWHVVLRVYLRLRVPPVNLLLFGVNNLAVSVVKEIQDHPELGIKVVGFLADNYETDDVSAVNAKIIGNYDNLTSIVVEHKVNHVVVGLSDSRKKLPIDELLDFRTKGLLVESVESFYERIAGKIPVENLRPSWLVFNSGFDVSKDIFLQKRILSIMLSIMLLVLTSPILLLTAIIIKLDSKGPVFYKQKRVGVNGRVYKLVKFRSMRQDAEKESGPVWSTPGTDNRVTRVGLFLRRTRIDELPQIYNVLRGDMDMVGPRPERPAFVEQLSKDIPYYALRHVVKPGITGWAQVSYGYASKLEHTIEKLQYDLFYIKNMSLTLDLLIIFETVKTVLVRKGS